MYGEIRYVHRNPVCRRPPDEGIPFDQNLLYNRGLICLDLPLKDARIVLKVAEAYGANAYLIPVAYRTPVISIQYARQVALEWHTEMLKTGKRLMNLDEGYDDFLWWTFCSDDIEAIEKDEFPGRICISIDKLDGHIRSPDEFDKWLRLSGI